MNTAWRYKNLNLVNWFYFSFKYVLLYFYSFPRDTKYRGWCKGWYSHLLWRRGLAIYLLQHTFLSTAMSIDLQNIILWYTKNQSNTSVINTASFCKVFYVSTSFDVSWKYLQIQIFSHLSLGSPPLKSNFAQGVRI